MSWDIEMMKPKKPCLSEGAFFATEKFRTFGGRDPHQHCIRSAVHVAVAQGDIFDMSTNFVLSFF